jgi:hypothetical protein
MANFVALAERLITANGRAVTLQYDTGAGSPVDSGKPWLGTAASLATVDTFGVFTEGEATDFLARISAVSRLVLSPVETGHRTLMIPGSIDIEPKIGWQLVDGSDTYEITKVSPLQPGVDVILYVLEVRK